MLMVGEGGDCVLWLRMRKWAGWFRKSFSVSFSLISSYLFLRNPTIAMRYCVFFFVVVLAVFGTRTMS